MRHAFEDLGYRRWEWKCNSRNEPSKRAAERFGFKSEGVFRQHMIVRGENRDTAWYSIIDTEWPALKRAYEEWLDRANFDNARPAAAPAGRDPRRPMTCAFRHTSRRVWVTSGHCPVSASCLLYPRKQTFVSAGGMSAKCQ
jgi:hypothetical protein